MLVLFKSKEKANRNQERLAWLLDDAIMLAIYTGHGTAQYYLERSFS